MNTNKQNSQRRADPLHFTHSPPFLRFRDASARQMRSILHLIFAPEKSCRIKGLFDEQNC
jgi:hypothetical protein